MIEFLVVFSTGGPDTFYICEGEQQFEEFLAYLKKMHWPVRRMAQLTQVERTTLIAGEWLYDGARGYSKGYEATVTGHYSYGVSAEVTESVIDQILIDQEAFIKQFPEAGRFEFLEDGLYLVDGDEYAERLGPKDNGMYDAPGWAWEVIGVHECDVVAR